jgi:hypothetical protein
MPKRDFCWNRLTTSGALNLLYLKSLTNCCVPHTSSGVCQFLCGRVTQRVTQIQHSFRSTKNASPMVLISVPLKRGKFRGTTAGVLRVILMRACRRAATARCSRPCRKHDGGAHSGGSVTLNLILVSWSGALPILRTNGSQRGSEWILSNRFCGTISPSPGS